MGYRETLAEKSKKRLKTLKHLKIVSVMAACKSHREMVAKPRRKPQSYIPFCYEQDILSFILIMNYESASSQQSTCQASADIEHQIRAFKAIISNKRNQFPSLLWVYAHWVFGDKSFGILGLVWLFAQLQSETVRDE